jgi:hypothetical protein
MTRTLDDVKAELDALTQTARRYQQGMHEGGDGFNPHSAQVRQLQAEYDRLAEATAEARCAAIRAAEDQEWTRDLTQQRRAAWNAWVRSQGATIHPLQVAEQIKAQGWSLEALKAAIKRHGL